MERNGKEGMTLAHMSCTVRVEADGSLTLPEETREVLGLQPGDEIEILIPRNGTDEHAGRTGDEEQAHRLALLKQMYADADAVERQPIMYTHPQKAQVAQSIAEKHRRMGMKV